MSGAIYMGIDPGLKGAVAFLNPATKALTVFDIPVFDVKGKNRIDMQGLANAIADTASLYGKPVLATVEDVHSMPAQGVASSFSFGFVAGAIQMAVAAAKIPIKLVAPGAWKRVMGLSSDKDMSRMRASQLYPEHSAKWARKKDDGRAEAVLLAHYGARIL